MNGYRNGKGPLPSEQAQARQAARGQSPGALPTAEVSDLAGSGLLFTVGKPLIGLYLGHASIGSSCGAAGSLVVFVVRVYYSGMILLPAAAFTKVYANRFGARLRPAARAVPVSDAARARQGLPPQPSVPGARR